MKKSMISFIVSFITICSISIPVFAISSEEITFNGYKWGTSYNEIFENEIDSSMEDGIDYAYQDNSLFVYQNVAGYYCFATYQFDDDEKLSKGCYVLKEEHTISS